MLKRYLSLALIAFILNLACAAHVYAGTDARFAEKVKTGIAKLGTGPDARVEVRLKDKTKVKGYVSETGEDYFVVSDARTGAAKTGAANRIDYGQVKQVKGHNLSTNAKIAIGMGLALAALVIVLLIVLDEH